MKVPVSWLNEFIDLSDLTPEDLAEKLTFSGIEVEGIETVGTNLDDHFVVGEVRTCVPHPNSDHLHLCAVSDGSEDLPVVCGAPNCRAGIKVALARIGARIPNGEFKIKSAKIRGEPSMGMLCSARELTLSEDHEGIMILDDACLPGTPLREILPVPETVLDLEITWNRPDCLSILGIAREFSALLKRPVKRPPIDFPEDETPVTDLAAVVVEAPGPCPRYTARVVTNLRDMPAPEWMRRRLEQCGVRPLGLIVDVTNYVMLECGQPLHAFDHRRLAENTVVIRPARPGEKIQTLDGMERTLDEHMLVIADRQAANAVAGVMGGADSEIAPGTTSVLIESALFSAPGIKRTATALGLRTESSYRFERGVDRDLADWAGRRAVALLVELGGARAARGVIDVDHRPPPPGPVILRRQRTNETIGIDLDRNEIEAILTRLGLTVHRLDDDRLQCEAPSWRYDLECEADLIEEIARMHGLEQLPDVTPAAIAVPGVEDQAVRSEDLCRQTLLGFGLSEAMHYSFLSTAELMAFDPSSKNRHLVLPNPVSADYAVMRNSLLPQLTASLGRNHARQVEAPALFELGRVFGRDAQGKPCEVKQLALGLCGPFGRHALDRRRPISNQEAMLWLKGIIESLLSRLHAPVPRWESQEFPAFEEGWSTIIQIDGVPIGRMGLVKAHLRHPWRLNSPLAVAELQLDPILAQAHRLAPLQPVPAFPAVRRDLALLAARDLTHRQVVDAIRRSAPTELTNIALFDIFEPKESKDSRRSMAYSLEFRSAERTLTDDEVNAACQKIMTALQDQLKVEVRAG